VTKDGAGQTNFTRVGIFQKDANDFMIDASGRRMQGYQITPPSTIPGPLGDVKVPTGLIQPEPTTGIDFVANLSKDWIAPTGTFAADATVDPVVTPDADSYNYLKSSLVYDSRGTEHTVTQYFAKVDDTTVTVYTTLDGTDLGAAMSPITLTFDTDGKLVMPAPPAAQEITNTLGFTPTGADAMSVVITYNGTSFQAGDAVTSTNDSNGYSAGAYVGVELANDGSVIAKYSNGERQRVGYVALATFPNEDGLTVADNTSWIATDSAGTPNYTQPGVGLAGQLSVTTLEGSNVDITAELVGLMTSQRNYQANSKVITTENQMLQSLMQAM
jgi:flagellar hook protein FlgE